MNQRNLSLLVLLSGAVVLSACGGAQVPAGDAPPVAGASTPSAEAGTRPSTTAEACEASGGTVVGDIGDGAIHRPEYRCPSGAAPSASVRPPEGGPVAIEGAVCCPR
ncbi:MAG TPA: hypothetical protein VER33_23745 [Polyangiaceae bacterium]|nr:hypothetical protein [Polyangiaceae bacterium]